MEILSFEFLGLVLAVWAARLLLPGALVRQVVLLAASLWFLLAYLRAHHPEEWVWQSGLMAAFVASGYVGYLFARYAHRTGQGAGGHRLWLAAHLGYYLLLTKPALFTLALSQGFLSHFVFLIGVSYILLRQLHVSLDARGGVIDEVRPLAYVTYLLSFHTLLAGPITRYRAFSTEVTDGAPAREALPMLAAMNRIATGLVKKFVVAAVLYDALTDGRGGTALAAEHPDTLLAFHIFAIYEYLDFSGYMDIMVGVGALIGVRVPENFNRPYLARNLVDFWGRWHITLAHWIRDYVFNPLSVRLGRVMPTHIVLVGLICYTAAFALVGLWHGISPGFFLWGLSQGIGLGAVKAYETWLRRRLGRQGYKRYMDQPVVRWVARVLTIEYFIVTVGLVLLDLSGAL